MKKKKQPIPSNVGPKTRHYENNSNLSSLCQIEGSMPKTQEFPGL